MSEEIILPEGLETIEDKIQYYKDVNGLNGDAGNMLDWLIEEIRSPQRGISPIKTMKIKPPTI